MPLAPDEIRRFDRILQCVLDELPDELTRLFDEIPLVVEDYPSRKILRELHVHRGADLRGVHSGIPLTRRSVAHSGVLPTVITIYRRGILLSAADKDACASDASLAREIRVTILHELGHYFGLSEDDLRRHGYG